MNLANLDLWTAAKSGDLDRVLALVQEGVAVDSLNSSGTTPLMFAAFSGNIGTVKLLLKLGANKKGESPLTIATMIPLDDKYIKLLKEAGAK